MGFMAGIWLQPIVLASTVLLFALLLAPIVLLNTAVFIGPFAKMRVARWRNLRIWALWIGYAVVLLYAISASTTFLDVYDKLESIFGLIVLTVLNSYFQQNPRPHRLLLKFTPVIVVIPAFLILNHLPKKTSTWKPEVPIIWVTQNYDSDQHFNSSQVYWQPNQTVLLQWHGKNNRLDGLSPAFAIWHSELLTLDGTDLVVTPQAGVPRRISLKTQIPDAADIPPHVMDMQPTRDGVMLNVIARDHYVIRVNLATETVQSVPNARRVRCAETTDRYVVNWSEDLPLQVRDGHDHILRQSGEYPYRFNEWDADPVDDLCAITGRKTVTMMGVSSITRYDIHPGILIASITMQPGLHQIWIAEDVGESYDIDSPACRLLMYSYAGKCLGHRTITGNKVLRVFPVNQSIAEFLISKYPVVGK